MAKKYKKNAKRRRKQRRPYYGGLTVPGYPHMGPFNRIGPTTGTIDAIARQHDRGYNKLGKRAYYTWNKADDRFMEQLKPHQSNPVAWGARTVFLGKKLLTKPQLGDVRTVVQQAKGGWKLIYG